MLISGFVFFCHTVLSQNPEIQVLTPEVCINFQIKLKLSNASTLSAISWRLNNGTWNGGTDEYTTVALDKGWVNVDVQFTLPNGRREIISKGKAVFVRQALIDFKVDKTLICGANDSITVTDLSPKSKTREWYIDGNAIKNGPRVLKYWYNKPEGYKSIYLTITDSFDCPASLNKDSALSLWPTLGLNIASTVRDGCAPRMANFDAYWDTGKQNIDRVKWLFPKASPDSSLQRTPQNILFNSADTFDVQVFLETKQGCKDTFYYNNFIELGDSIEHNIVKTSSKPCIARTLNLKLTNARSNLPFWTFSPRKKIWRDTNRGKEINVRFLDTISLSLTVFDRYRGCNYSTTFPNIAKAQGPIANFTSLNRFYCATPDTVEFTNTSFEEGTVSYKWLLRDNKLGTIVNTQTGKDFFYRTTSAVTYDGILIANSSNGCSDTSIRIKAVVANEIYKNIEINPKVVCPGQTISLTSDAGPPNSKYPIKYNWWIYNPNGTLHSAHTSHNPNPTFTNVGLYSVKLRVQNKSCRDSNYTADTIKILYPQITFKLSDSFACVGNTIFITRFLREKRTGTRGKFIITALDSAGIGVFENSRDTILVGFSKSGRYKLEYEYEDTTNGGCKVRVPGPTIRIGDLKITASADKTSGCNPLTVNFTSGTSNNVNYRAGGNVLSYAWKRVEPQTTRFFDSSIRNARGVFQKGRSRIYVVATNGMGCKDSTGYLTIQSGIVGDFRIGVSLCANEPLQVQNFTTNLATTFKWSCDSSSVSFLPSNTNRDPKIFFAKPGVFNIRLMSYGPGCGDTTEQPMLIQKLVASFTSTDSVSYCAPRIINFRNTNPIAKYNTWIFGDGETGTSRWTEEKSHLYLENKPNPGYTVTLISESENGCRDTVTKNGFIRIIGPVPDFEVIQKRGCEPLRVDFIQKSTNYSRFLFDYGNGKVQDTTIILPHVYKVFDRSLPIQVFKARLVLYDSLGCTALKIQDDSINVLKNSEPNHRFESTQFTKGRNGCTPLFVKFRSFSLFTSSVAWDFDNNGIIDGNDNPNATYTYTKQGVYRPVIIGTNINGCKDTFYGDTLWVHPTPIADFKSSKDTLCAKRNVFFTNLTRSLNTIKSHRWDFGEPSTLLDTSTAVNTKWSYKNPFTNVVELTVTDDKGCVSKAQKGIYVFDTAGPAKPVITSVSVEPTGEVILNWRKFTTGNFYTYRTFADTAGKFIGRYTTRNVMDTQWKVMYGSIINKEKLCFTVQSEDTCSTFSQKASSHCTINLRDSLLDPFTVHLYWDEYSWWNGSAGLGYYQIWRKAVDENNFSMIGTVSGGGIQKYVDSFLCNKSYCYFVRAIHKNGIYTSRSNNDCVTPLYKAPDKPINVKLATVLADNKSILVKWEPYYKYIRGGSYVLLRNENPNPNGYRQVLRTTQLDGIDVSAEIGKNPYSYKVAFVDHCGQRSELGAPGNTILLTSSISNSGVKLEWTPYGYWYSGVKNYELQFRNKQRSFTTLGQFVSSKRDTNGIVISNFGLDTVCFRIFAIKDTSAKDTSFSNLICEVPSSYMHIPTGFSPNGDGNNDVYKVVTAFIYTDKKNPLTRFEMRIFNRWGQKVFETFDKEAGWDGTYLGKPCSNGMYMVRLKAIGYDGKTHFHDVMIYLMR